MNQFQASRFPRDSREVYGHRFQIDKPSRDWPWFVGAVIVSAIMVAVMASEAKADNPITQAINLGGGTQAGAAAGAWSDANATGGNATGGSGYGGAGGVGMGGVGTGTGTGGAANNMGNAQSVGFSSPHQAPAVFMGAAMPTAICQKPIGGFLSLFIFGGAGASGSITFEECMKLETGRAFVSAGRPDLAVKMICMTEHASTLSECQSVSTKSTGE